MASIQEKLADSPRSVRLRLNWKKMREQILALNLSEPGQIADIQQVISAMEENYARDSYHSLSILDVFAEDFRCPLAEFRCLGRVYTIAHGDDGVEVVAVHVVSLRLVGYCAVLSGYFHFGNNHIFFKFPFFEDILQMLTNRRHAHSKQLSHSLLSTPKCFVLDDHLDGAVVIGGVVEEELDFVVLHNGLLISRSLLCGISALGG